MNEPMTPAECNLRGLPWMPIDTVRLLDSDLFALATGDEFKAAVALWCKAWQQVPAASLPNDDRVLAHLSGAGKRWKKVKEQALRGFVLCADGRWYHPVIAEKALEAWEHREEFQESSNNKTARQQRWRERQKELSAQLRDLGVTPPVGASLRDLERLLVDAQASTSASTSASTVDARETPLTGQGQDMTSTSLANARVAKPAVPPCPHLDIISLYHKHLPMGRQVNPELWSGTRAKHLQARWREAEKRQRVEWWEKFFLHCAASDFLTGKTPPAQGRKQFEISLDWIVNPTNFAKIYEGAYHS